MRSYVARRQERAFSAEAERQSLVVARLAADPDGEEAQMMCLIEDVSDADGWIA